MKLTRYKLLRNVSIASLLILTITACGGGSGGSSTSSSAQDTNSSTPGSNAAPAPAPAPAPNPVAPVTILPEPPAVSVEVPAQLSKIELKPVDIIYDASRGRYYASLGSSNSDKSGRIAIIDPTTGAQTFSEVIGALPGVMAMSRDAKYLYVAVSGSTSIPTVGSIATTTEIVKLALPSLTEVSRVPLGIDTTYGILYANDIEVSPTNSDVFAIVVRARSSDYRDVVLYNGTSALPKRASDRLPIEIASEQDATDQIVFSNDGTALFAYDSLTTGHALRKLAVTSEGLVHVLSRETRVDSTLSEFATPHFAMLGANPMIGGQIFDGNDLLYKGQIGNSMTCVLLANVDKVACATGNTLDRLTVFSSGKYDALGTIESVALPYGAKKLVKGPAGQIAMIVNDGIVAVGETNPVKLYLLGDPLLK